MIPLGVSIDTAGALRGLQRLRRGVETGLRPALVAEGEAVLAQGRARAPVFQGSGLPGEPEPQALRESGELRVASSGARTQVSVRFGGPRAPYALEVHELPVPGHVGPTKYLERPFLEALSGMPERLAARLRARLGARS